MEDQSLGTPSQKLCHGIDSKADDDILNCLPECVVAYVLSLLPTKDAVRTSVLSKTWEYLWTSVYDLDFDDKLRYSQKWKEKASFVNFVERVLLFLRNQAIGTFRLACSSDYDTSRVKNWISMALWRNVKRLDINLYPLEDVELPHSFFSSDSLTEVKLRGPAIYKVSLISTFSKLTILDLHRVTFVKEIGSSSSNLLIPFPFLKVFKLNDCKWLNVKHLKLNAPALAIVEVTFSRYECEQDGSSDCAIEIHGASLAKFRSGGYCLEDFILSSSSLVVEAALKHCICDDSHHNNFLWRGKIGHRAAVLLGKFSNVKCLTLSGDIIEALEHAEPLASFPLLDNLIQLIVTSRYRKIKWSGPLMEILRGAPKLESLEFDVFDELWDDADHDRIQEVPDCIISHLKIVTFKRFGSEAKENCLVKFLLKNALVLKEMSIRVSPDPSSLKATLIEHQLLVIPRASDVASVVINGS